MRVSRWSITDWQALDTLIDVAADTDGRPGQYEAPIRSSEQITQDPLIDMSAANPKPLLDAVEPLSPEVRKLRVAVIFDCSVRSDTTGNHCLTALAELCDATHLAPDQLATITAEQYDLYVYVDDGLSHPWPDHLRPRVFWAIDTHLQYTSELARATQADLTFCAQRVGAQRMRADGITAEWLPLAANPKVHRPISETEHLDWSFVGNAVSTERLETLRSLSRAFPTCFAGNAYGDELARIYSSSRAVVNRSIRDDLNMRVFEAMACGALLISDGLSADSGMDLLFREGEHYLAYTNVDELVDRLRWALEHPERRRAIAERGHELVHARHTYRNRMAALLERSLPLVTRASTATPGASPAKNYYEWDRPEVVAMVPVSARNILELGSASGALGASLKRRQQCRVTGIEYVADVARLAADRLDRVITGDCETLDFNALFQPGEFDCLVAADVLEHLRDPEAILRRLKPFLTDDAAIVTSIPNVRNGAVLKSLVEGHWTYQDSGILDRTHLRFFTRREIDDMFTRLGCELEERHTLDDPALLRWNEMGKPTGINFGPLSLNGLPAEEVREFFVIQWLTRSRLVAPASRRANDKPGVSIVVLTDRGIEYTQQCVDALIEHTPQPYELIFVDNRPAEATPAHLKSVAGARVLSNPSRVGLATATNQGLSAASGDYVVLMNNDAIVTAGWLDRLLAPMRRDACIGIVGPRSNYVVGQQLVEGTPYASKAELQQFAAEWADAHAGKGFEAASVDGFCLALRREVIQKLGGLDSRFGSGSFEYRDFGVRTSLAGWKVWVADDAFVHRYGLRPFIDEETGTSQALERDANLFADKWGLAR